MRINLTRLAAVALAGAAVAGTASASAQAAPFDPINGCTTTGSGALRILSAGSCSPWEAPLTWRKGIGTVVVRSGSPVIVPNEGALNKYATASCRPGEQAISGGQQIEAVGANREGEYRTFTVASQPMPEYYPTNLAPTGWFAKVTNLSGSTANGGAPSKLTVHVVCVS
jgi:hypothetical protein